MPRSNRRRSVAIAAILRVLAEHYNPSGRTYSELKPGLTDTHGIQHEELSISLRHLKRYVSDFAKRGWVNLEAKDAKTRIRLTVEGYFYYHRDIAHHDTTTIEGVPRNLLPTLMVKGVWRLTEDQGRYFSEYLQTGGSLLVLLPTGAGKTLIATIEAYKMYLASGPEAKVLYTSPYKAINFQTMNEFQSVLEPLGMHVVRQDGDYHPPEEELSRASLVVSTFESAEIALRQRQPWMDKVKLVIVDELTSLDSTRDTIENPQGNTPSELPRGATLDLLVTGLMSFFGQIGSKARIICLGIPNASQPALQSWLGAGTAVLEPTTVSAHYEEKLAVFQTIKGERKLTLVRKDGSSREGPWASTAVGAANSIVEVVMHYLKKFHANTEGEHPPILVFVHGRKATSELALRLRSRLLEDKALSESMSRDRSRNQARILQSAVVPTKTVQQLAEVVNNGIAFHHAGLFPAQRRLIEQMMNDGSLSVLFATTTLSHGVDFPIGAVIVDGRLLRFFNYSRLEYLQIRGRVDHKDPFHRVRQTSDVVIVLSDDSLLKDYEKFRELLLGSYPELDSQSLDSPYIGAWAFKAIQIVLSTAGTAAIEELRGMTLASYDYHRMLQGRSDEVRAIKKETRGLIDSQLRRYSEFRLVNLRGKKLSLGPAGKLAKDAGLSFDDAVFLLSRTQSLLDCPGEKLEETLLRTAASLSEGRDEVQQVLPRIFIYADLPPELQVGSSEENREKTKLRRNTLLGIIGRWTDEELINNVIVSTPNFQVFEAGLLVSARALSRNLKKVSKTFGLLPTYASGVDPALQKIAQVAANLSIRVRFGVKDDIASSEVGLIASRLDMDDLINEYGYPEFLTRVILRLLIDKGISSCQAAKDFRGRKAITLTNLKSYKADAELASHVGRYHRLMVDKIVTRILAQAADSTREVYAAIGGR